MDESIHQYFERFDTVAVDIETTGLSPFDSRIVMCQLGFPDDIQIVIDARYIDLTPILPYLRSRKWTKLLFNGKFDEQFFLHFHNTPILQIKDGYQLERILHPEQKGNQSFEDLASSYLGIPLDKTTRKSFLGGQKTPFTEKQINYGAEDVKYLFPLIERQEEEVEKIHQKHIADLENDLVTVVSHMELTGVPVDKGKWSEILRGFEEEHHESRIRLMELLQKPVKNLGTQIGLFEDKELETESINLGSPVQIKKALANIGIFVPDTSNQTISVLPYAATKELTTYRGLDKLLTSYGRSSFLDKIHPFTGRIHPNWRQTGTETGRFSCREPNMQQVPEKLRKAIGGEKDYMLLGADFSQMELRILAQESKDPILTDAFVSGKDVHAATASTMFNIALDKVTKEQRFTAKTLNFGITYGMGVDKFTDMMNEEAIKNGTKEITIPQGQSLMNRYKETYKVANQYLKTVGFGAIRDGYVETRWGRRRYFKPVSTSLSARDYKSQMGGILRAGANMPIQGTNADITKMAMIDIHNDLQDYGFKASIILQVHDEIVLLAHKSQVEDIKPIVVDAMLRAGNYVIPDIPIVVEPYVSEYWPK